MSWARFDDGWSRQEVFLDLPHDVRWHYLTMVEYCCANDRYDGVLRRHEALRCSDLDDPAAAVRDLVTVGLLKETSGRFAIVQIEQHVPPPWLRDPERKAKVNEKKRRSRAHLSGDHGQCLPTSCPDAPVTGPVTGDITSDAGTGREALEIRPSEGKSGVARLPRAAGDGS